MKQINLKFRKEEELGIRRYTLVSRENMSRVWIESSSIMMKRVLPRSLYEQMLLYFVILGHVLALDGYQHQQHGNRTTRRDVSCQKRIGEFLDAKGEATSEGQ